MASALPLPKYHQVYLVLREQLSEGAYAGGVPAEMRLMEQFGVARVTVRKALDQRAPAAGGQRRLSYLLLAGRTRTQQNREELRC